MVAETRNERHWIILPVLIVVGISAFVGALFLGVTALHLVYLDGAEFDWVLAVSAWLAIVVFPITAGGIIVVFTRLLDLNVKSFQKTVVIVGSIQNSVLCLLIALGVWLFWDQSRPSVSFRVDQFSGIHDPDWKPYADPRYEYAAAIEGFGFFGVMTSPLSSADVATDAYEKAIPLIQKNLVEALERHAGRRNVRITDSRIENWNGIEGGRVTVSLEQGVEGKWISTSMELFATGHQNKVYTFTIYGRTIYHRLFLSDIFDEILNSLKIESLHGSDFGS